MAGRGMAREATSARLRAACSTIQDRRRTLSEPRSNEPIAQKPVTIVPSATPATNQMSGTSRRYRQEAWVRMTVRSWHAARNGQTRAMEPITWLVIGLIAGWLAGLVMKASGYGLVGDILGLSAVSSAPGSSS